MEQALIGIASSFFIAVFTSWITVHLSIGKFRSERWWERKAENYSKIIDALHHSKEFSDQHLHALYNGRELDKKIDQNMRKEAETAHREIRRISNIGAFFLSKAAISRISVYEKEEGEFEDLQSWHEYLEASWDNSNRCLNDMIKIAKDDLKIR